MNSSFTALARPMLLMRVERLDEQGNLRVSKPLWLAWVGEQMPPLEEVWRLYLRLEIVAEYYNLVTKLAINYTSY
ncbi:hypothetical protein [Anabaena catenula]|uniref:Uncharacterized protein n=1 Tax=Anabaena catenula FACHB-362 TaxID=2692877 RepID=A0ABR8IXJ0_9NOST|nr:hypothetical protein [Anabaena catenula]MBD2690726.1 hypothetical protein [Anabaena catenula FACHB-362]